MARWILEEEEKKRKKKKGAVDERCKTSDEKLAINCAFWIWTGQSRKTVVVSGVEMGVGSVSQTKRVGVSPVSPVPL
jgi:hypothetical protein